MNLLTTSCISLVFELATVWTGNECVRGRLAMFRINFKTGYVDGALQAGECTASQVLKRAGVSSEYIPLERQDKNWLDKGLKEVSNKSPWLIQMMLTRSLGRVAASLNDSKR